VFLIPGAPGVHAQELSAPVEERIAAMAISRALGVALLEAHLAEQRRIRALPQEERREPGAEQRRESRRLTLEAEERRLLQAVNARDELPEQMVWFWFNHFNVFWNKFPVGNIVADYEERAIRPHALGSFCAMLRAVTYHPAMLVYLDNWQNSAGKINENHARELLELHTLGVEGGYKQADVQELARVLTGLGLPRQGSGKLSALDPARHDAGTKRLLGREIARGRRLGHARGAMHGGRAACQPLAGAWRGAGRVRAVHVPGVAQYRRRGDHGIRPHLPRERRARHRPRPWQGGARLRPGTAGDRARVSPGNTHRV
jgi:uncharacterized protein (DUF1800 family)